MTDRSSFEAKVLAAFTAAALVVGGLSATAWKTAHDAADAARLVAHTHEVLGNVSHVRGDTLQVELSTQSFRIAGDPKYLAERDANMVTRESVMYRLRKLTQDNPQQQERWAQLRAVLDERIAISKQVEHLRKTQGPEAANAYVATAPLRETRERTYGLLREMEQAERELLDGRIAQQSHTRQLLLTAGTAAVVALLALLAGTYLVIRRQVRAAQASQQALAESEEHLSTTLHSIGDGVLATDTQGRITRMNPVAERLTGWPLNEALGRPIDQVFCIINEETRAPATVPVARVLETGEVQELANHTALIARDGSECPIADSAAPIRDTEGHVRGVVLVFRDESAARQARRAIRDHNRLLEESVRERTAQLQESEGHLRNVISNVPAMIAYVDAHQRYVYANRQYQQRFAPDQPDITGLEVREVLGPERYATAGPIIARALQGEAQNYDWQPFPGVWHAISYLPRRDAQDSVAGYYVLGTDITERKQTEEQIQALNFDLQRHARDLEQVSRALKTLSAGNRTLLRATSEAELLEGMCQAIVGTGGYHMAIVWYRADDEQRSIQPMAQQGFPGGLAQLRQLQISWADNQGAVATAIRTGEPVVIPDVRNNPHYGPLRPYLNDNLSGLACPLRVGGQVMGALAIYHAEPDIFGADEVALLSESADDLSFGISTLRTSALQQKTQEAMDRLAHYDTLTGLPNEPLFTQWMAGAIAGAKPFAAMQVNIERLSEINDALGFSQGDQVLREFGARLRAAAPASASVARLRGDEFALLLPGGDAATAIAVVQQLGRSLAQPLALADIFLDISARTGIALFPAHGSTPHDLYRHMDIAMHQAKMRGLDYFVFDPARDPDRSHRLNLAGELRAAIEHGDLDLHLQPKVDMATGAVCGAEGLVRWHHAERGLILPGEFIGLAEHTGLIKPLTEWVIATSLQLNQQWMREGRALPIAVNLSARNLRDENLIDIIRQLQRASGVTAGLLELEITESTVMEDAAFALRVLHGLRDEGIPLYIDDFGTGYSSLSYLLKLPVDYIKIDQSFVRDMPDTKDAALIVRSTIDLAHDLGRKVVAEGVETRQHWDQLAAFGCDHAQGYFLARPMPAHELPGWMAGFQPPLAALPAA